MEPQPAKHRAQVARAILAARAHVDMRVGAVGDEHVSVAHHLLAEIGVEVERGEDRHARPHERAHPGQDRAVGARIVGSLVQGPPASMARTKPVIVPGLRGAGASRSAASASPASSTLASNSARVATGACELDSSMKPPMAILGAGLLVVMGMRRLVERGNGGRA